jgi:hypothetical protein
MTPERRAKYTFEEKDPLADFPEDEGNASENASSDERQTDGDDARPASNAIANAEGHADVSLLSQSATLRSPCPDSTERDGRVHLHRHTKLVRRKCQR